MAALTGITAVRPTADTKSTPPVRYGATLGIAIPVYLDVSDLTHKAADNDASVSTDAVVGLTITPGVNGGYGYLATGGSIILVGATMAVGVTYYLGSTPGEIVPESDVSTGDAVTRIGTASTTTQLDLDIKVTNIPKA